MMSGPNWKPSTIIAIVASAAAIVFSGWVLVTHSQTTSAEGQRLHTGMQAPEVVQDDGGINQDFNKGLGDSLARNFDVQGLKKAIARANQVLPAVIETLESHPEILQPYEKACSAFAAAAGEFRQAASDQDKSAAAQKYFGVANDAVAALKEMLSGPYGKQLKNYIELEQALANYFSLQFSKPLIPPSPQEDNARKLLLHAFEHIAVMRDAVAELAVLQELGSPPSHSPGRWLSTNTAVLEARLKQLAGNPFCQPASR